MATTLLDDEVDPYAKYLDRPVQASVEIGPAIVEKPIVSTKSKINLENLKIENFHMACCRFSCDGKSSILDFAP